MQDLYKTFVVEFNRIYAYPTGLTAQYDEESQEIRITGSNLKWIEDLDSLLYSPIINGIEVFKVNGFRNLRDLLNHFQMDITPIEEYNGIRYLKVDLKTIPEYWESPTHIQWLNPDGTKMGLPTPLKTIPDLSSYEYETPRNRYVKVEESGKVQILFRF